MANVQVYEEQQFEFGLQRLLDGFADDLARGGTTPPPDDDEGGPNVLFTT